jgi:hypothetical protein
LPGQRDRRVAVPGNSINPGGLVPVVNNLRALYETPKRGNLSTARLAVVPKQADIAAANALLESS